eukprot:jgi/Mesvir1/21814/Mv04201-RA.3
MKISQAPSCIAVLCGLPGAGKSTLAHAVAMALTGPSNPELGLGSNGGLNHVPANGFLRRVRAVHICMDTLTARLQSAADLSAACATPDASRDEPEGSSARPLDQPAEDADGMAPVTRGWGSAAAWKRARTAAYEQVAALVEQHTAHATSDTRLLLLVDDNMHLRSMRKKYWQLARKARCAFLQVFLRCHLDEAANRNAARAQDSIVPDHVLRGMAATLEPPAGDEYSWEANTLVLETSASAGAAAGGEASGDGASCGPTPTSLCVGWWAEHPAGVPGVPLDHATTAVGARRGVGRPASSCSTGDSGKPAAFAGPARPQGHLSGHGEALPPGGFRGAAAVCPGIERCAQGHGAARAGACACAGKEGGGRQQWMHRSRGGKRRACERDLASKLFKGQMAEGEVEMLVN